MRQGFSRRDLMRGASAAGLFSMFKPGLARAHEHEDDDDHDDHDGSRQRLPTKLQPHPVIRGNPSSERYWRDVRRAFPLPPAGDYCHYNTGTTGSQPFFSINNLAVYNNYKSQDPVFWQNNLADDFPDLFQVSAGTGGS